VTVPSVSTVTTVPKTHKYRQQTSTAGTFDRCIRRIQTAGDENCISAVPLFRLDLQKRLSGKDAFVQLVVTDRRVRNSDGGAHGGADRHVLPVNTLGSRRAVLIH
jgi:hypothetical protein